MSDKTVQELAGVVGIPLERLLEQMKEAGIVAHAAGDAVNEEDKIKLLAHLRKRHGKDDEGEVSGTKKVTLKRRTVTTLKQGTTPGKDTKTINIQVNKKKTYIKREEAISDEEREELEKVKKDLAAREAKQAAEEQLHRDKAAREKAELDAQQAAQKQQEEEERAVAEKKAKETEAERLIAEKAKRLEASVERNAEKVRKQAAAKKAAAERKATGGARKPAGAGARKPAGAAGAKPGGKTVKQPTVHRRADKPAGGGKAAYGKKGRKKGRGRREEQFVSDAKHAFEMPTEVVAKEVNIPENIVVSELAQKMSVKAAEVIKHLMKLGIMSTINQSIDQETAVILV
ncbi:MAG: translation initiation factor IF-2 N-terminal domain-containing protein, partial [Methyloprofundus sp.]|nr:translation initiation factor IF-2 N-terminal domain-containing protein [Methyloprofundus sp.]